MLPADGLRVDASTHQVDALVARYERPGPRYTSYPTAPVWNDMDAGDVQTAYAAIRGDTQPISLYIHLPFCERMCLFCGCHVIAGRSYDRVPRYIEAIATEARHVREVAGPQQLAQLHLGGGTPTFLAPADLGRLLDAIESSFSRTSDAEVGIEIDPVVTTREHLQVAREHGFNRLSMGVQDFVDDVQTMIERQQPDATTTATFEMARDLGFASINLDLMYGLPGQSTGHLEHSARRAMELGADRVALFGYAHVPWMKPHQHKLEVYGVPSASERWRQFTAGRETLLAAGYKPIGLDHFARPTDELALAAAKHRLHRNFQGYTVLDVPTLLGLGISAIGDVGGRYVQNAKRLSDYLARIEAGEFATERGFVLSADDHLRRVVINTIMCNLHIDFATLDARFDIVFENYFAAELQALAPLINDGIATLSERALHVTDVGRLFLRNVAMLFDAHLDAGGARFSQTV